MNKGKTPNRLIHSSSPYLKQHAYNPVDWYPWCDEALERAKKEDKPILISIGYSACHWCHVMERESFENELIASWMNDHYICIKVDREERPDVDQVYMEAVHVMGVQGGWPLNVFATPDQKPFYGGTYFRPEEWLNVLQNITRIFNEEREKLVKSASDIADRVATPDSLIFSLSDDAKISGIEEIRLVFDKIQTAIDQNNGGIGRAPKFPNPSIWSFLLMHKLVDEDPELDDLINRTLTNMSFGGIYDHLGGGFARYSVDEKWFAPHFEKMLYDNAQLISLYAQAHMVYGEKRYKQVVYETVNFVRRELMAPGGGFYAALDADSEGEEGKYYVWDYREFTDQAGEDGALVATYFNLEEEGNWEKGKNILFVTNTKEQFAESHELDPSAFSIKISQVKKLLHNVRSNRVRPGLDNKVITGWNGLMIKGLVDAYRAFGEPDFLKDAVDTSEFIHRKGFHDGRLMRIISSEGDAIEACLDDYALYIDALITLYQVVFDEKYILRAKELTIDCIQNFYDPAEELFYYSGETSKPLFARKKEIFDNVIPSSNSVMAHNLFFLGSVYDDQGFMDMSRVMHGKFGEMIHSEPLHLTNWGKLMLLQSKGLVEIVVSGNDYEQFCEDINREYLPYKILYGVSNAGSLPLTKNKKPINDRTTIYVCKDKTCKLPVHSVKEALNQIQDY